MIRQPWEMGIAALVLVFSLSTIANGGQQYEGWRIDRETTEGIVFMAMTDSVAVVTHKVVMEIDDRGVRKSLSLTFPSGLEKKGTEGELRYYWSERKGANAWWNYMLAGGKLQILHPEPDGSIPIEWYGRTVACVTVEGKRHIGRLRGTDGNKTWFALEIEGAAEPVKFRVDAVKELQALK